MERGAVRARERGVFDDRHLGVRGTLGDVAERTRQREVGRGHVLREDGKARREEGRGGHGSEEESAWRRVIIELHSGEGFWFAVDGDELWQEPRPSRCAWSAAGRADHGFAEAPQSRLESLFGNGPDGRPDPLPVGLAHRGSGWAPRSGRRTGPCFRTMRPMQRQP